ncbi:alpha/beta hydrolase [Methanobrevibacter sp.]|uniref:alpha/beta hydrolase n=1 Tax=Methanobrevibacter sp. TaxID=66852 RepID=UPI00388F2460
MNKKIKVIIIIVLLLLLAYAVFYFTEYNHAEKTATDLLAGTENVSVTNSSNGLFLDGYGNDTALIFYPGAKNEYVAYLPMFVDLASKGVDCYIVQMPLNFAIFAQDSADQIIDTTNYSHYIMAGHSLGGLSAASYATKSNETEGVILIAAYPIEEIDKPVLSIYGSEDGILNMESYNKAKPLMKNLTEFVIEGGNHEQFANYGAQKGDNVAKISYQEQQSICVNEMLEFINNITLSN